MKQAKELMQGAPSATLNQEKRKGGKRTNIAISW
jgi:hypothetical protein